MAIRKNLWLLTKKANMQGQESKTFVKLSGDIQEFFGKFTNDAKLEYKTAIKASIARMVKLSEDVITIDEATVELAYDLKEPLTVPDVIGNDIALAIKTITDLGFVAPVQKIVDSAETVGTVILQSPKAGTKTARSEAIQLRVSGGTPE